MTLHVKPHLLHFPTQDALMIHLEKHPTTSYPYFTEKKITQVVAAFFANENYTSLEIDKSIESILKILNVALELNFPKDTLKSFQTCFSIALKDLGVKALLSRL